MVYNLIIKWEFTLITNWTFLQQGKDSSKNEILHEMLIYILKELPIGFPENTGSSIAESSLTFKNETKSFRRTNGVFGHRTSKVAIRFFTSSSVS